MLVIYYPELDGVHGIARYVQSLLANLGNYEERVVLVTGHCEGLTFPPNIEVISIPVSSFRGSLVLWSIKARRAVKKLAKSDKITCINLQWPPLIPCLFVPNVAPIVLTAHTTYHGMSGRYYGKHYFDSQWGKLSLFVKTAFERYILAKCKKVIALTRQGEKELRAYDYKGEIAIIPNGVDLTKFTLDETAEKQFDVIFAGRIETRKGSRSMVELCKYISAHSPDMRICIVGYGDDFDFVQQELGDKPNITLTGKVAFAGMVDYFNKSKVYVSTSFYEGLPGTCIEAMSLGLPGVVWNFEFYEGLVVEGVTGYQAPVANYEKMHELIVRTLSDEEKRVEMGRQARSNVIANYNWKTIAGQVAKEFRSV